MAPETLADAIASVGGPVPLLRNSPVRPRRFPVRPEFTNRRSEQRAWRESCVLFEQSHHMTDLYLRGPGALSPPAGLGVNSFGDFVAGRAKQYVVVAPDEFHPATGRHDVTARREDNSAGRAEGPPLTWADHGTVRDALLAAGETEGLVLAGAKAYSTANLESGWIPSPLPASFGDDPVLRAYREWLPADRIGSLGGSLASQDRTKVTLVWNSDDVTAAMGSLNRPGPGAKYTVAPAPLVGFARDRYRAQ